MKKTTINISEENFKKIHYLKLDYNKKSIDEVITLILEERENEEKYKKPIEEVSMHMVNSRNN